MPREVQGERALNEIGIYKNMVNNYKITIVFGEYINAKKNITNPLNKLLNDPLYKEVKDSKYSEYNSFKAKIKLFLIKRI